VKSLKLGGLSAGYVLRVGIAAVLFILLFKWLAAKTGFKQLQSVAAAV
jgi:hypothetical protein